MKRILITGAAGQIGSELTLALRKKYGGGNVLATDIKTQISPKLRDSGPFQSLDVLEREAIVKTVREFRADTIFHLSAILSASGENKPQLAWNVNLNGTFNILEAAREHSLARVFVPSSIAAFGPETPRLNTPNDTILKPRTMYGLTKVAGELLGDYYVRRFNLDVRGCRYPGIISHETLPGGGTTDYAVAIFYEAVKNKSYNCFLRPDTRLPMMYMPDCLKATLDLMEADFSRLNHHADFNIAAMSFSASELAAEIKKHIPEFIVTYEPDYRQAIAESWPETIDDSAAREEWGWKPDYDLAKMTADMIAALQERFETGTLEY
ncbi:MAG: NAD-dependent epimerase/dehydratase family protein [Candidatus Aminicenantes bacterium]|nr:NAD-dependent epimerase/dehydratase family protein [Candidatus Aminicenantes bacterium]